MNVISKARIPIMNWASQIESGAIDQAINLADLEGQGFHVVKREEVPAVFREFFLGSQTDNLADMTAKGRGVVVLSNLCPGAGAGLSPRDPITGRYYKKETA